MKSDTIRQLQADRRIVAECPGTGETFSLADAVMFYVGDPLPEQAQQWVDEFKAELAERRRALAEERRRLKQRSETGAKAVGIGKILEKVVPAMKGFELDCRDARALFEPIDYVVFNGLTARDGEVDSLVFLDVKTGGARLQESQKQTKDAVEAGRVALARYGGEL